MKHLGNINSPILIFGGPYSNLAATEAIKLAAEKRGIAPKNVICSGDMVAYCAEPFETLELIREWGIHVVMGNCEESLAFSEPDCGCGFEPGSSCSELAMTWFRYADQRVTLPQRHWLQSLPRSLGFEMNGIRLGVVHGSLSSINEFLFASSDFQHQLSLISESGLDVVIGGHSGIPFGRPLNEKLWLNAGVIGMPANDAGAHGWYLLIEPLQQKLQISWHRLDYDFQRSSQSTIAAGMREYGEALQQGLWPSTDILPEREKAASGMPLKLPPLTYSKSISPVVDACRQA